MQRQSSPLMILGIGLALAVAGGVWIVLQQVSGAQPWGPLLSDNVLFAKALPFVVGIGVLLGLSQALNHAGFGTEHHGNRVRRFSASTALTHWINALGFLIALGTGAVQYLKGVLDVPAPVPLPLLYRFHYLGAALIVLAVSSFVTHRLLIGDRRLLPDTKRFAREVRGLASELPGVLGSAVAGFFGLSLRRPAPLVGQFTYYERLVSFPAWVVLVGLIVLSGLLKAMRFLLPIPGEVVNLLSVLHVAAMVLVAAKLLDHLRYVASPSRWPLLVAMVTTWVSVEYVRARHPGWALEGREARPESRAEGQMAAEAH
ncbi:MAG: hypothetical protein HY690_19850 [Chloroflexi bacterium]|nr:hypothetical protein [Chloroflexota bacterium]